MSLPNFQDGYLDTKDGHKLYWSSYGNPEGEPLLMVHGGGGSVFDPEALTGIPADQYHVILLHQRGVGKSTPKGSAENNSVFDNAEDIERLRKHLNIEKWSIFGWSMGALIQTVYAAIHPERCNALYSYAPHICAQEDWDETLRKVRKDIRKSFMEFHDADTTAEAINSAYTKHKEGGRDLALRVEFQDAVLSGESRSFKEFCKSKTPEEWDEVLAAALIFYQQENEVINDTETGWLEKLVLDNTAFRAIPKTLIYGKDDVWTSPNERVKHLFNEASFKTVTNANHNINDPNVQKMLRRVLTS